MPPYPKSLQCPPKAAKKKWRPGPRKATGELAIFEYVWITRERKCEICSARIHEFKAWRGAHKLPKGTFPEYRLIPQNIALVCSVECHGAVDRQRKSRTQEWISENEKWIAKNGDPNKLYKPGD